MSKITEKLNRILAICEPVMTADRMQNVSIEVRDIKDILRINANKTMAELLEAVKSDKKYIAVYLMPPNNIRLFLDELGNKQTSIESAKKYNSIAEVGKAITKFSVLFAGIKPHIEEYKTEIEPLTEPCKKQELQEKMSSLIANGENIPAEMHDKWNEFVENC